ncbi:MAG: hypothetical protein PWP57_538 [Candidatus Atribacteria bacterium]|nr:hypothetical protein [Candidatus Atribacteria bacterium]
MLLITVNSPGEVYYWLYPFLRDLSNQPSPPRVWVYVPPCQFSTGQEEELIKNYPLVERVFSPRETVRFCLRSGKLPSPGLILYLGGDLLYAVLLKRRTGFPLWVYGGYFKWLQKVDLYLARFWRDFEKLNFDRKIFLGDLLFSSISTPTSCVFPAGFPRCLFLPGSRKIFYPYLLPFFFQVGKELTKIYPKISLTLGFPSHYNFNDVPELKNMPTFFRPFFGKTSSLMAEADLIVTIPGSNNLEIAYRGKRGIVILPFWGLEKIPLEGPMLLLEKIPFWGKIIKRNVVKKMAGKRKWISLPNELLDEEVLKELRGDLSPLEVVDTIQEMMNKEPEIYFPEESFPRNASPRLAEMVGRWWDEKAK